VTLLSAFGLFAAAAMLVAYALEDKSPWFTLALAAACALGAVYVFLQGAWPFAVLEAIWCVIAFVKWRDRKKRLSAETAVDTGTTRQEN
jgi:hypothetical protein